MNEENTVISAREEHQALPTQVNVASTQSIPPARFWRKPPPT